MLACMYPCMHASVHAHECMRTRSTYACVRVCVRARERASERACAHTHTRTRVCACVCACARVICGTARLGDVDSLGLADDRLQCLNLPTSLSVKRSHRFLPLYIDPPHYFPPLPSHTLFSLAVLSPTFLPLSILRAHSLHLLSLSLSACLFLFLLRSLSRSQSFPLTLALPLSLPPSPGRSLARPLLCRYLSNGPFALSPSLRFRSLPVSKSWRSGGKRTLSLSLLYPLARERGGCHGPHRCLRTQASVGLSRQVSAQ
jgi:hypothetical protein